MTARPKKSPDPIGSDPQAVEHYLQTLEHPRKAVVHALRRVILGADARVAEGIKWNAPSFRSVEWFATFDLRSAEWVQIVFHRGAKVKQVRDTRYVSDPAGILKWITNDRCTAKFTSMEDVEGKTAALAGIVTQWVENLSSEAK